MQAGIAMLLKSFGIDAEELKNLALEAQHGLQTKVDTIDARLANIEKMLTVIHEAALAVQTANLQAIDAKETLDKVPAGMELPDLSQERIYA